MNYAKRLANRLGSLRLLVAAFYMVFLLMVAVLFFSQSDSLPVLFLLLGLLLGVRLLYAEERTVKISTMRNSGRSIVFSDDARKRFAAISIVELRTGGLVLTGIGGSQLNRSKVLKASKVLAEHVGACSIEINSSLPSIRYSVTAESNTASDACQKSELAAERILRVIRELNGADVRPGILEGEQLQIGFLNILGGNFDSFRNEHGIAIRDDIGTCDRYGFTILSLIDSSFTEICLKRLSTMIRNLGASVTYVINIQARRTYNENVLIDGAELGRTWVVSPYIIVGGGEVERIEEASTRLRNEMEDEIKSGVVKIESGSSIINKVGKILFRKRMNKKLFLSNDQLISHVFSA